MLRRDTHIFFQSASAAFWERRSIISNCTASLMVACGLGRSDGGSGRSFTRSDGRRRRWFVSLRHVHNRAGAAGCSGGAFKFATRTLQAVANLAVATATGFQCCSAHAAHVEYLGWL